MRKRVLGFIVALLVVFVSAWFCVRSEGTPEAEFEFIPNALAVENPVYVQVLKTQADVDAVKKAHLLDATMAGIGSVVRQGTEGLVVYPPEEITQPQYHLQELEKQTDKTIVLKGYEFTPDAVYTKDPVPIHIIQKAAEIKAAKQTRWLADKNLLSIGAAIICPDSKLCYTIASHTLKTVYQYISPLETQVDVQP